MKSILFYICTMVWGVSAYASAPQWFQGSLVLNDQQVLVGEISVEVKHDMVLFRHNGTVDVYPAYKVQLVRYYDVECDVNRKFISIRNTSSVFRVHHFYEVVLWGEVTILRREKSDVATNQMDHEALGFEYMVRFKDELIPLRKFRSRVYPRLKQFPAVELSGYVEKNKLNPNDDAQAVRIIRYFNQMVIGSVPELALN